jgi:hypothetical protein
MATPARGLSRERHTGIKAAAAATAVGGFIAAWLGFMNSHPDGNSSDTSDVLAFASTVESRAVPTAMATATPTSSAGETPDATAAATEEPTATPSAVATTVPRSRISRGS